MRIGEVDDVNCYLHLLNLIVTKGILDQRTVKDMVAPASTVAHEFTHKGELKPVLSDEFKNRGKPVLSLIQCQLTHWNSTDLMLRRITKLHELLETIYDTTLMCELETSCISEVIPHTKSLNQKMMQLNVKFVKMTQESLIKYLDRYFYGKDPQEQYVDIKMSNAYHVATILDPRFKKSAWFQYEANFTAAVGRLKALVEVKLADPLNNKVDEPDTTAAQFSTEACVTEKKLYWVKCMEIIKINENAQSVANPITIQNESNRQINAYLVEETIDSDSDPLKFWQLKQKTYPQLATLNNNRSLSNT
uniref:Uncharacterized protein n=1 Tax=Romanomermis culicivorax TaxID=13658 RepID=A0A915J781_ROMCU